MAKAFKPVDSFKIIDSAQDVRHAGDVAYFVVEFYSGTDLVLVEDFQMPHLKTSASMPFTDANGDYVLMDGSTLSKKEIDAAQEAFVAATSGLSVSTLDDGTIVVPAEIADAYTKFLDPIKKRFQQVQRKTIALDVTEQIIENIERYIKTVGAKGISGDRRDKSAESIRNVKLGISQRPEVSAIIGTMIKVKN